MMPQVEPRPVRRRDRAPQPDVWLPPGHGDIQLDCGSSYLLAAPRRRSAATWAPSALPSLWAYHDAGVTSSLWQNYTGTTPVTSDGQTLGRADDLGSAGRNLIQPNAPYQPNYSATGFGGKAAVHVAYGTHLARPAGISGAQTWGISFKLSATPAYGNFYALASLYTGSVGGIVYLCQYPGYTGVAFGCSMSGTTALVGFSPTFDTAIHTLIVTYSGSGTGPSSYTCDYDGVSQSLSATSGAAPASTWGAIGALNDGSYGTPGYWRRAAFSSAQASSGDRANLSTWLAG